MTLEPTTWRICFYSIVDNNIKWFQYRILHRIIGVQEALFKYKISDSNICRLCLNSVETIFHLFAECEISNTLWQNLLSWIHSSTGKVIQLDKSVKLLGFLRPATYFWPLNFILLITKYYIFSKARKLEQLNLHQLLNILKIKFLEEKTIAKVNSSSDNFTKNWSEWMSIFGI